MELSAPARIAELLRHQDDLDKIVDIKQKLQREKAVIDNQLKTGVQQQIHVLSNGTQSLAAARQRIDQIRDDMALVQRLRAESMESIEDFSKINNLSRVLQNFDQVERFLNNFKTMSADLHQIQLLLADDGDFTIESRLPNLLTVHYRLNELRDVKDDALFHAQSSSEDVRRTLARHFGPLDKVIDQFDRIIFDIAECLLEIIRTGDPSLVVRTAKIIDYEEKQDLVADISYEILHSNRDNVLFKSLNKFSRKPRGYPARFFAAVEESVARTFENCKEQFPPQEPDALLDNLGWVFNDLELARLRLVRLVPNRWKIFDKFVKYYHTQVQKTLNDIMETDPTAADILLILEYVKDYYTQMESALGVSKEQLQPPLLDGKEDSLYDDYLALLVSKLREWYGNFAKTEKEPLITRQIPPQTSAENWFGMEGEQIMFKLVTQQIEVAASSGRGRIVVGCIEECASILRERQKDWQRVMHDEVEKDINDVPNEHGQSSVPPGLFDYLIALANDQIRGADFTEAISSKRAPSLSKKYSSRVVAQLDDVCDGFIEVAKDVIGSMIRLIFNDLIPPFKELFSASSWYKGKPMRQIVDTITEYARDCKQYQNPIVFDVFIEDLVSETVLHYLGALGNGTDLLKVPKGTNRIKSDIELMYELFSDPQLGLSVEMIQEHFKVFEHLLATLESPVEELPLRFEQLREDFWDAPLDLFEKMVRIRKGMDSKAARDIIVKVRSAALQKQLSEAHTPTFLSKNQSKR